MLIKKEIIINAPVNKVWKIFLELEKWAEWSDYIYKAYWTSKDKWKVNSTFVQIVKGPFQQKQVSKPRILKVIPNKQVTWIGTRALIKGKHTFTFEKANKKTKIRNIETFHGILAPFIFPFIKKSFELYFEQFLLELKYKVEK